MLPRFILATAVDLAIAILIVVGLSYEEKVAEFEKKLFNSIKSFVKKITSKETTAG